RLDTVMSYRYVEQANDANILVEALLLQGHQQPIGAVVVDHRASHVVLQDTFLRLALIQLGNVGRLGVIELDDVLAQRRKFRHLALGLKLLTLAGSNLISRRDQQHVADLTLVEPLGLRSEEHTSELQSRE